MRSRLHSSGESGRVTSVRYPLYVNQPEKIGTLEVEMTCPHEWYHSLS